MADGSVAQPLPGLTRAPRSMDFTNDERDLIVAAIIGGLARGEPLVEICRSPGMPAPRTVSDWAVADPSLSAAIARARLIGTHAIADEARLTARGYGPDRGGASSGDAYRDKLIIDTDLRLIAKFNPKEFGEAVQMRMADANGEKLDTTPMIRELLALVRPSDGSQAIDVTPERKKPASE